MNYIQQINSFWDKADDADIKGNDIAVYFALLRINNKYGWRESFRADWAEVSMYAHISKNTFYKSIDTLQNEGFIRYEKGAKNYLKPKFFILIFENRKGTEEEQKGNKKGIEQEQKGNLDKLINNKTDKLINKALDSDFEKVWDDSGKRGNKQSAVKAYNRLSKDDKIALSAGLKKYIEWLKKKGDFKTPFQKHLSTYINGKCWQDELPDLAKPEAEIDWKKFHSSPLY